MKLFERFDPVSLDEWKSKIEVDLKGKSYQETLVWNSIEGIEIQPVYHKEAVNDSKIIPVSSKANAGWQNRSIIPITSPVEANTKALKALKEGSDSIVFRGNIHSESELSTLLDGIMLDIVHVGFITENPIDLHNYLDSFISNNGVRPFSIQVYADPIGDLIVNGDWNEHDAFEFLNKTENNNYFNVIITGDHYANSGATIIEELAFSLAQANEYIARSDNKQEVANSIEFSLGIGSNYFFEIAKLRALRRLWPLILKGYNLKEESLSIHCNTSIWNYAIYDPYVNMLRGTTAAMSAIIGGCDSISVHPFDAVYNEYNKFSDRIARNISIILKEESFLDKVVDPSHGSYYIEQLTDEIAGKTWKLFQKIEAEGGLLENLKNGNIQSMVKTSADKKQKAFEKGEITLLGVNKYPNQEERMADKIKIEPSIQPNDKQLIEPIRTYRLSNTLEIERLESEHTLS